MHRFFYLPPSVGLASRIRNPICLAGLNGPVNVGRTELDKGDRPARRPLADRFFFCFCLPIQSQPCHWRNAKSVAKRSTDVEVATTPAALSQNINLFQSLRVLQEGENGEDASALSNRKCVTETIYTCHALYSRVSYTPSRGFFFTLVSKTELRGFYKEKNLPYGRAEIVLNNSPATFFIENPQRKLVKRIVCV